VLKLLCLIYITVMFRVNKVGGGCGLICKSHNGSDRAGDEEHGAKEWEEALPKI
jgi:hypothetical protein